MTHWNSFCSTASVSTLSNTGYGIVISIIFYSLMNSAILTRFVLTFFSPVRRIDFVFDTYTYSIDGFTDLRRWARKWLVKPVFDLQTLSHNSQANVCCYTYSTTRLGLRRWARKCEDKPVFDLQILSHNSQANWLIDWFIDWLIDWLFYTHLFK
jgi:hypothetical protein